MSVIQALSGIEKDLFRRTCARFATGVAIATVAGQDGTPHGLTINSFTSVSCSPPLVLICIDYRCTLLPHFRSSSWYGVNVLADAQHKISVQFSERQGDRFDGIRWERGHTGVPVIHGCLAAFECCVSQVVEAGDHAILIGEVASASSFDGEPLVYFGSTYRQLKVLSDKEELPYR